MTKRKYSRRKHLDPARKVIRQFCGGGALAQGIAEVARICRRDPSNVYRWMLPTDDGGTGGYIPTRAQRLLDDYAKKRGVRIETGSARDAAEAA